MIKIPFNEKSAVEDYIIEKLKENNWIFQKPSGLPRDDYVKPLLTKIFKKKIKGY